MADPTPGTVPVIDHRRAPAGLLPRAAQTWLMGGLALGIIGLIVMTGRPQLPTRDAAPTDTPAVLSPDRVRAYQERLRSLELRARPQPPGEPTPAPAPVPSVETRSTAPPSASDPEAADRKRRDAESLFSSPVVLSRRPDAQRLSTGETPGLTNRSTAQAGDSLPTMPSLDDVTNAVLRATRSTPAAAAGGTTQGAAPPTAPATVADAPSAARPAPATPPIRPTDSVQRILAGTVIDTVLTNRLDGSAAAPVNCLVTNPVYSHDRQRLLIPAGARVLGEAKPVQAFGDTRLAVSFTRLVLPDGRTYPLQHDVGLNAIGDAGLRDQVDQHYRATFGASAAIGLLSGFAQFLTGAGLTRGTGDRPIVIAGGVSDASSQATAQTLNRFLNRLPTVTIREGHRVKVYLTSDLELPTYAPADAGRQAFLAQR